LPGIRACNLLAYGKLLYLACCCCCCSRRPSKQNFDEKVRSYASSYYKLTPEQASSRLPRIYTSKEQLSENDFIAVYKVADALVIPTHGEGWGRPQIEAMAMELPVITTNWSGPTAFMNERIAYPLAIDGLSVVKSDGDPNFFKAFIGQKWAQPSVKHMIQLMRHVYNNPKEGVAKGKAARKHIQAHFTPEVVARVVAKEVKRLQPILKQRQQQAQQARAQPGKKGMLNKMGSRQ
jgi:glycosyltransferase involved in cell wall biosynthesis